MWTPWFSLGGCDISLTAAPGPGLESPLDQPASVRFECGVRSARPPRVLDKNGAEVQLSAPKLRTLLALLLVNRGRPVSVDRIADILWGEVPPRSAPNLVQGYIRDLRQRLGAQEITTVPEDTGSTSGGNLLMRNASRPWSAPRHEEGLALWHGAALEEWAEQPWARAHAARLEEMRLSPWRPAWPRRSTQVSHPRCSPSSRRSSKTTRYVSGCVSYWLRLSTPLAGKLTRSRRTRRLAVISLTR